MNHWHLDWIGILLFLQIGRHEDITIDALMRHLGIKEYGQTPL